MTRARATVRNAAEGERSTRGTALLATLIIDCAVLLDEPDEAKRIEEGISKIVRPFVDEIANSDLSVGDRAQFKLLLPELHLLCSLCVLVLKAKVEFGSFAEAVAGGLVERIVEQLLHALLVAELSDAIKIVLRIAVKKICEQFVEWAFAPVNEKALQVLGILFCPNTEQHADVVELCIRPFEGEFLNSLIVGWAMEHYPFDRDFISGRSTKALRL